MKHLSLIYFLLIFALYPSHGMAQRITPVTAEFDSKKTSFASDSVETTDVPEGIYAWTIDERFGSITATPLDTLPHLFQNENLTDGPTGHYNSTGNVGAPRISRYFTEQQTNMLQSPFLFLTPYAYFLRTPQSTIYTNTRSPFTTLTYHSCGNKTDGEDNLKALFAVNINKRLGIGFNTDYIYGRGYYQNQSTAHFNGTLYASYIGEQYQLHTQVQTAFIKNRENGGIESDTYVTQPETFSTSYATRDIPTLLDRAWNKLTTNSIFLTHRYSLGYHQLPNGRHIHSSEPQPISQTILTTTTDSTQRPLAIRIPTPSSALENKGSTPTDSTTSLRPTFVAVTSFIHTLQIAGDDRRFISNERNNSNTPGYFAQFYTPSDSANDQTHHFTVANTLAIQLNEGLNRWVPMGLRLYAKHQYHSYQFTLPFAQQLTVQTSFRENVITLGGEIFKQQGERLTYNALGEYLATGGSWGQFNVEGQAQLRLPIRQDTLSIKLRGFLRNERPNFYYRHYYGRNAYWDNQAQLTNQFSYRIRAALRYKQLTLSAAFGGIQHNVYLQETLTPYTTTSGLQSYRHGVNVKQASAGTQLLSLTLSHALTAGIFHLDNELTYQATTSQEVNPLPALTVYSNLYLRFRIAKVLHTELGTDMRYFTRYQAPAYSPIVGLYAMQDPNHVVSIGNYPIINAYANFHLKRTRFYVMVTHLNHSTGRGNPFLVPTYPLNRLNFRLGLSWNFIN